MRTRMTYLSVLTHTYIMSICTYLPAVTNSTLTYILSPSIKFIQNKGGGVTAEVEYPVLFTTYPNGALECPVSPFTNSLRFLT